MQEYYRIHSYTRTQRWIRLVMQRDPPHRSDIAQWLRNFLMNGSLRHRGGNGRPRTAVESIEEVRLMVQEDPRLSIRHASAALDMPYTTVHRILRRCLLLHPYKMQKFASYVRY